MRSKILKRLCTALLIVLSIIGMPVTSFASETKADEKAVTVRIPVSCTGINTTEEFIYELSGESTEFQIIESRTLTLKDKEKGEFCITYTYPGTYHYTVVQNKGSDSDTTYDNTVYHVDVYVTEDEKGNMYAEPVVYLQGESGKKAELSFTNEKKLPEIPPEQRQDVPAEQAEQRSDVPAKQPTTGDDTSFVLWAFLMYISGMSVIVIRQRGRKKERGDHHA